MKLLKPFLVALSCFATCTAPLSASATTTAAGHDQLRIQTSWPKKSGDSLFSYTVEWQQDGGKLYHSTGMSFLDANKHDPNGPTNRIAKKLAASIKESMIQLDPNWRGLEVEQPEEQAAFILNNKAGYALTTAVVRDYTNQALTFDLLGKRFNSADVKLAFDIVLAADVEYLDKFSSQKLKTATHGNIEIKIDDLPTVQIKTDGKTTREIETEISQHLSGAKLSDSTLVTSQIGKDTRNIKPFDGSEVQLNNLAAKSISIDITDPSVGVLVKFKFKGGNTVVSSESHTRLFVIAGLGLLAAGFFRFRKKRSPAI